MSEAQYWKNRYEMLMASFGDALRSAGLPPPPTILADKESYEAGYIAGQAAPTQRKPVELSGHTKNLGTRTHDES